MYGKTPKKILRLGIDLTIQDWFETCSNRSNGCIRSYIMLYVMLCYIMQLFSADTTMFLNVFFYRKKVEITPSIFFSPIAAQTAQIEESIFQNLAYIATAYKIESKVSFFKTNEKPLKIKDYHTYFRHLYYMYYFMKLHWWKNFGKFLLVSNTCPGFPALGEQNCLLWTKCFTWSSNSFLPESY